MSDYTKLVASGLAAAGDVVTVYAPPAAERSSIDPGVTVVHLPDHFGFRALLVLEDAFTRRPRPDRILIQYVPHAYGWKAMNLLFAAWVATRAQQFAPVWVMFHEVAFPFSLRPLKYAVLGTVTRLMARLMAGAADRVFVSILGWEPLLRRICPRSNPPEWLPVPCNVDNDASPITATSVRNHYTPVPTDCLIGHFGTFGESITEILAPTIIELLRQIPDVRVLLVGRNSDRFRETFIVDNPAFAHRVAATGELLPSQVSAHLKACDLLLQLFPDGVSSRRGSIMAGLANGVPVVTNLGFLSEPVWAGGGVALTVASTPIATTELITMLLIDATARTNLSRRAVALYQDMFAVEHTIAKLREGL